MKRTRTLLLILTSLSAFALAQQTPSPWRRATDPPPAPSASPQPAATPQADAQDPTQPVERPNDAYGQPSQAPPQQRPAYGLPAQLTLKPGTYISVRLNQGLHTDHNHVGDTFSASLMQPVIVDGVVIANAGQLAYGRVAEAEKQHADKPSRLGLELTGLTLADGTQAPLASQLVSHQGGTTPGGVQAGTVAGTTVAGTAIGGMIGYGTGAAIGAGVGAAAGIIGVILTRHHPTVLYPETPLTFRTTSPVTVSTLNNPQAYRFVGPEDYGRTYSSYTPRPGPQPRPAPAPAPYYYGYGGYYPGYYYPYAYWGPSIVVGGGWGWGGWGWGGYGRGWGRGWYGRRWR